MVARWVVCGRVISRSVRRAVGKADCLHIQTGVMNTDRRRGYIAASVPTGVADVEVGIGHLVQFKKREIAGRIVSAKHGPSCLVVGRRPGTVGTARRGFKVPRDYN